MRDLQVLLLCDYPRNGAVAVVEHTESLVEFSRHDVHVVSISGPLPLGLQLNRFDTVVVHFLLFLCSDSFVTPEAKSALREYNGPKVVFVQDEYRCVNAPIDTLGEVQADLLFTCVSEEEIEKVYPTDRLPALKKVNNLTGYVPEHLSERAVPTFCNRPVDVGCRSRRVPAWLGALGQDKWRIGRRCAR